MIVKSVTSYRAPKIMFNQATERHMLRCRRLAQTMGKAIGLDEVQMVTLAEAAATHDIGKVAIPIDILTKPGTLTETEWQVVKMHPEVGYRIALLSGQSHAIAEVILSHHERWDGSGYPRGLKGEQIPLLARIVAVVDAYDAMTSTRPYRRAVSRAQAILELRRCAGSQFDPELVALYVELMSDNALGEAGE